MSRLANVGLVAVVFLSNGAYSQTEETTTLRVARLLPDSIVVYAEIPSPPKLVDFVLEHPLRPEVEAMPAYQAAWQSDELVQLRSGISLFEASMGKRWPKVVNELTAGGVCIAFDAQTDGLIAFVQARNGEIIRQLRDTTFSVIRGSKLADSPGDPIRSGRYRGVDYYSNRDQVYAASLDNLLVITNQQDLGKQVIDRFLDSSAGSLLDDASFAAAFSTRSGSETAWGYVDVGAIRYSGEAKELYSGRTDNFVAELLLGGIMSNLKETAYATASLQAGDEGLGLRLATPHDVDWVGEDRAFFFGADNQATAPKLLQLDQQVFALSTYRDMSEAWLRAGDLMTDEANEQLAQADTQLTTFFSGRDFGEDILGSIEPEFRIVAVRQDFEGVHPQPAIKLPAFALQFQMRDPGETQPQLRRVFQSFIGFINVVGAMNGNPQFDMGLESKPDGTQLVTATYVPDEDVRESKQAAINFNFSPTLAFSGKQLIVASTSQLAEQLLTQATTGKSESSNTVIEVKVPTLKAILADNFGQLVAQNMLEKGHSQQEAENEIGILLELLELLNGARLELSSGGQELSLDFDLRWRQPGDSR